MDERDYFNLWWAAAWPRLRNMGVTNEAQAMDIAWRGWCGAGAPRPEPMCSPSEMAAFDYDPMIDP